MTSLLPLLLAATPIPALPPPTETARRVMACGVPKRAISIVDDQLLQEDVIKVRGFRTTSESQLLCIATASLDTGWYVEFAGKTQKAFRNLYWQMSHERNLADAKAWLSERDLLDKIPRYDPTKDEVRSFLRQIEAICGAEPGTVFVWNGRSSPLNSEAILSGKIPEDTIHCAIIAPGVGGLEIGFVGNEALAK